MQKMLFDVIFGLDFLIYAHLVDTSGWQYP